MYNYSDVLDGICSKAQYYWQYPTPSSIKVGDEFLQNTGICSHKFKIIFVGEGVALGVIVSDSVGGLAVGKKELFHSEGIAKGFKYQDTRACYRLRSK